MLSFQQSPVHLKNRLQLEEKRIALLILVGEAAFVIAAITLYLL